MYWNLRELCLCCWHARNLGCTVLSCIYHVQFLPTKIIMAALRTRCGHYIFALWFLSVFYLFFIPRLISAAADWMSTILRDYFHTWCGASANIECRSEMCCTVLAANTGRKNDAKKRHLCTIAQLCRAISSQLRHVSTIGQKLVKQQYLLHMSLQYGELRPTSGWDRFVSLGDPSKFQRVSRLGSITAQPNCGVEQRAPTLFGRAAITLGIGPHF